MSEHYSREDLKPDYRQSADEFEVLVETGRRLAETLDLSQILQVAVDGIAGLAGLDTAAVYLLEGQRIRLGATYPPLPPGFPDDLREGPLADHPHIQQAVTEQRHLLSEDFRSAAITRAEREVARQRDLRTVLYVPMLVDGEGVGAFIVGSTGKVVDIPENRIGLSWALANLAGLATRNATLYRNTQAKSRELEASLAERLKMEEERETLQAQLAQAQKMESIGRLAGGVAHDFNNLLQVIQGYTDLAMNSLPPDGDAHGFLQEVQKAADRSASITRQLLAFARRQTIAPEVMDLSRSVEGTLNMLKRLLGEDLDLVWAPSEDPLSVFMDPSQLDQVLANLCVNARDAIDGVGKVTIETQAVCFDQEYCRLHEGFKPGHYCMLAVSDDGCGFDREVRENLFEPFFTTKQEGTGLGLAMIYGIVKQNNGFINVYSEPGVGTTFKIYLPCHDGEARREVAEKKTAPPATGGETVMVVEDDDSILKLLQTILKRHGYQVVGVDSPLRAVELAAKRKDPIHLLITDVVMPEINGRELAGKIGELWPGLKVLFMSGYTSNVIAHRGVLDDDVCFIQKPFEAKVLGARVREILDEES